MEASRTATLMAAKKTEEHRMRTVGKTAVGELGSCSRGEGGGRCTRVECSECSGWSEWSEGVEVGKVGGKEGLSPTGAFGLWSDCIEDVSENEETGE